MGGRVMEKVEHIDGTYLESDRLACLAAGMDAYASKPFKIEELLSLIEDLTKAPEMHL